MYTHISVRDTSQSQLISKRRRYNKENEKSISVEADAVFPGLFAEARKHFGVL